MADAYSPHLVFYLGCVAFVLITIFSQTFFKAEPIQTPSATASKFSLVSLLNVSSSVKRVSLLAGIGMIAETINLMGMSLYVYAIGGGYRDVGLIAGLIVAAGLVCQLLAPTLQEKLGSRGIILLVYGTNAVFLLLLFWRRTLAAAYTLFPIIGGLFTLTNLTWLALAQDAAPEGQMGAATGFYRGTLDLTNVFYYLAFGALSARFTVATLLAGAAFILLGLVAAAHRLLAVPSPQRIISVGSKIERL
ncbi:MAG: MFS transporter [Firmicutes bacterium]|nr:MFS transporter [Bacillota bacterium]